MSAALTHPPLILTDDQFEDMTRKGAFTTAGRVELRRGVIAAMSPVYLRHATCVDAVLTGLKSAIAAAKSPLRAISEISIRFGGGFQPTADIAVWSPALVAADHDGPLPADAVKLVIEVADSSLEDDLGAKAVDYARASLAEYWVADVKTRILYLHDGPTPAGYSSRRPLPFGETAQAASLPLMVETTGF